MWSDPFVRNINSKRRQTKGNIRSIICKQMWAIKSSIGNFVRFRENVSVHSIKFNVGNCQFRSMRFTCKWATMCARALSEDTEYGIGEISISNLPCVDRRSIKICNIVRDWSHKRHGDLGNMNIGCCSPFLSAAQYIWHYHYVRSQWINEKYEKCVTKLYIFMHAIISHCRVDWDRFRFRCVLALRKVGWIRSSAHFACALVCARNIVLYRLFVLVDFHQCHNASIDIQFISFFLPLLRTCISPFTNTNALLNRVFVPPASHLFFSNN